MIKKTPKTNKKLFCMATQAVIIMAENLTYSEMDEMLSF